MNIYDLTVQDCPEGRLLRKILAYCLMGVTVYFSIVPTPENEYRWSIGTNAENFIEESFPQDDVTWKKCEALYKDLCEAFRGTEMRLCWRGWRNH